jgi:hypothetical protein
VRAFAANLANTNGECSKSTEFKSKSVIFNTNLKFPGKMSPQENAPMDVPETIVDVIKSGGPAGAGVALMWWFVPKAREAYQKADEGTKKILRFTEPLCWACGIAMILVSVYQYSRPVQMVTGTVSTLKGEQSLWPTGDGAEFYFSKNNRPGIAEKEVSWIIKGSRLNDGKKIPLTIIGTTNQPDRIFEMEMLSEFYDGQDVSLKLDFPRTVTLTHGKTRKTLELTGDTEFLKPAPANALLHVLPVVHAQSKPLAPAEAIRLLETDDPDVRRQARDKLAASTSAAALPVIDTVAVNPDKSYRAWLGVLSALNQNHEIKGTDLSPAVLQSMVESLATPGTDVSIIGQIKGYMIAHTTERMEPVLRAELKARSGPGAKIADNYELTDTFFGVLYNLGVEDKDKYRGPDAASQTALKHAVSRFDEAWRLKPGAASYHVAQYPKALYGWALTLQDRSILDAKAGVHDKKETDAARDKYAEFLKEATAVAYPAKYANHLSAAKQYIAAHP